MRPHLDGARILPTLTPVAQDDPHSSAAIKGCLPTGAPLVGCQLDESLASLLTKRGEKAGSSSIIQPPAGPWVAVQIALCK